MAIRATDITIEAHSGIGGIVKHLLTSEHLGAEQLIGNRADVSNGRCTNASTQGKRRYIKYRYRALHKVVREQPRTIG